MRLPRLRLRLLRFQIWTAGLLIATSSISAARQEEEAKTRAAQAVRTDLYGDPLPTGAIARMGAVRDFIDGSSGAIVLSPNGKTITATTQAWWKIPLRLWDVETGRGVLHLRELEPRGNYAKVRRVAFSPDGKTFAVSEKQGARLCDLDTGTQIRRFPGSDHTMRSVFIAPDGKTFAAIFDHSVVLWDVATGHYRRTLVHSQFVSSLAFAPGGKILAIGDMIGDIRVWDVETGVDLEQFGERPRIADKTSGITCVTFLSDKSLMAADREGAVRLWDTDTGKARRGLEGHAGVVNSIAITPDGKTLATASADGTTLVWDVTKIGE